MAEQTLAYAEAVIARGAAAPAPETIRTLGQRIGRRRAAWGVACVSAAAGFIATSPTASDAAIYAAGPDLAMLLRFMALVKAGFALGLVALSAWRLGFPASPRVAAAYLVACALMPAGAGLIWHLAHVITGAALFHAGLITVLALFWLDRDEGRTKVLF